jgi:hypothetical protein
MHPAYSRYSSRYKFTFFCSILSSYSYWHPILEGVNENQIQFCVSAYQYVDPRNQWNLLISKKSNFFLPSSSLVLKYTVPRPTKSTCFMLESPHITQYFNDNEWTLLTNIKNSCDVDDNQCLLDMMEGLDETPAVDSLQSVSGKLRLLSRNFDESLEIFESQVEKGEESLRLIAFR